MFLRVKILFLVWPLWDLNRLLNSNLFLSFTLFAFMSISWLPLYHLNEVWEWRDIFILKQETTPLCFPSGFCPTCWDPQNNSLQVYLISTGSYPCMHISQVAVVKPAHNKWLQALQPGYHSHKKGQWEHSCSATCCCIVCNNLCLVEMIKKTLSSQKEFASLLIFMSMSLSWLYSKSLSKFLDVSHMAYWIILGSFSPDDSHCCLCCSIPHCYPLLV